MHSRIILGQIWPIVVVARKLLSLSLPFDLFNFLPRTGKTKAIRTFLRSVLNWLQDNKPCSSVQATRNCSLTSLKNLLKVHADHSQFLTVLGAKLLVLALWSDEYAQFEYRKKQYRIVTLRVLNSPIVEDFLVGVFPSGMCFWLASSDFSRHLTVGNLPQSHCPWPVSTWTWNHRNSQWHSAAPHWFCSCDCWWQQGDPDSCWLARCAVV